ncbi:MAG: hypothetical protein J3K34DRAFT_462412 [Monoraphidium minutum]|nr:MAG: hypothetical protein J3K34DRAFT_462412 [Monoraphidium minutum]
MGRLLLAADFTLTQPDPIADFGLPATVGLSIGVVCTVILSGMMSGLTLGLLSLDRLDLEVMLRTGTAKERAYAARLAPIVKYPHWVLATLVIFNTVSSVALPLCMDRLVSSVVALIVSSTAIVLFGEIVPQAVCSRHGLAIGGTMAPLVRVLMWLTYPLSWPIGWLLDTLLGTKGGVFGRRQLMALVDLHRTSTGMGGPLADDEFNVILGALDMTSKTAASNMTPLDKVFMLSTDDVLDKATLQRVLESGHSRVPVYEATDRSRIAGLIITKELLQYVGLLAGPQAPPRIGDIELRDVLRLPVSTRMYHLLDIFQTGQSHMALLTAPMSQATGAGSAKWKGGRLKSEDEEQEQKEEECLGAPEVKHGGASSDEEGGGGGGGSMRARRATSGAGSAAHTPRQSDAAGGGGGGGTGGSGRGGRSGARSGGGGGGGGGVRFDLARCSPLVNSYANEAFHIGGCERGGGGGAGGGGEGEGGEEDEEQVAVGIITLEDVIEEMMGEEIVDETDAYIDNEKTTRVNARLLTMSLPPQLRRVLLSAGLKHEAAAATAAALRGGPAGPVQPKLMAWTSTPQLKGSASAGALDGGGAAPGGGGDGAPGAAAGGAAGGAGGGGAAAPPPPSQQSWFSWRPTTPHHRAPAAGGGAGGDAQGGAPGGGASVAIDIPRPSGGRHSSGGGGGAGSAGGGEPGESGSAPAAQGRGPGGALARFTAPLERGGSGPAKVFRLSPALGRREPPQP